MKISKLRIFGLIVITITRIETSGQTNPNIEYYKETDDGTIYTAFQQAWKAYQPISYVSLFPTVKPVVKRSLELIEGEGRKGSFLEGNIYQVFDFLKGRHQGRHSSQTFRSTFDFGSNFRMTNDDSHPVLPQSFKVGLGIDKVLWDNKTHFCPFKKCLTYSQLNWRENARSSRTNSLKFISLGIKVMHYSDGQAPGFFRDTLLRRNDYKKGDFSTNYIQTRFYYTQIGTQSDMLIASLGYQWDGNFGGPFSYSEEQEKSYGHNRLLGLFQYNFRPLAKRGKNARTYWMDLSTNINYSIPRNFHEFSIRFEPELILDNNLSLYPHLKKARFSTHAHLMYTTYRLRTLGFDLHAFYGRDYLNIRFDDVIFTWQLAVTLTLKKYSPPIALSHYINVAPVPLKPTVCPPIL